MMKFIMHVKPVNNKKKSSHGPVVGLSKARDLNHIVAMEIQLGSSLCYFHVNDEFTRFSNAVI